VSKAKKIIYLVLISLFIVLNIVFLIIANNLVSPALIIISFIFGFLSLILLIYLIVVKADHKSKMMSFSDYVAFGSLVLLILAFITSFFFQVHKVDGNSMKPTLEDGKLVCVYPYKNQSLKDNDIIVIKLSDGELLVKRLFASPGDTLTYQSLDGVPSVINLTSNTIHPNANLGETTVISWEQWLILTNQKDRDIIEYTVIIPDRMYLAFGDNYNISLDSRFYGLFERDQILGKVLFK
jgi:signal peptidase I